MEYSLFVYYFFFSIFFTIILFTISFFFVYQKNDYEKISAYECGFTPFEDARNNFDVKFYLVAILFIIFDLEVVFLFPWAIFLTNLNFWGYWLMFIFLIILLIGFLYEWKKGALDW